jgi:hypothetical protein
MKRKIFIGTGIFTVVIAAALNINTALNAYSSVIDVTLKTEAQADGESGSNHGRPLLQNTTSGAYKCANCSGSDCGAAC